MDGAAFSVRDGRLYVEELACTELAARFGTPLFVMSETRLRSNVRRLGAALAAGWPLGEARLLPSIIAFLETGAYQEASAVNFNGLPHPSTVLVCGTTAEVVKRRETIEDVLGRDAVPERLYAAAGTASAG